MVLAVTKRYRLVEMRALNAKVMQVFLQPEEQALKYQAGQYLQVVSDQLLQVSPFAYYSIANAPQATNVIELHIRHAGMQSDSGYIIAHLQQHQYLNVSGPLGKCIYRANSLATLLLATGTGFAPMKALIEAACAANCQTPLHLYWGASTLNDLYLPNIFQSWHEQLPHFQYTPVLSAPPANWQGACGYLVEIVCKDYTDLSGYQVYAAGAPDMVKTAFAALSKIKLNPQNFFSDT